MSQAFDGVLGLFSREPAILVGLVDAALMLAVTFGLPLTEPQKGAIDAVLALLASVIIRSQVVPVKTVAALIGPAEITPPAAT
jgi:hypothetical protein